MVLPCKSFQWAADMFSLFSVKNEHCDPNLHLMQCNVQFLPPKMTSDIAVGCCGFISASTNKAKTHYHAKRKTDINNIQKHCRLLWTEIF